VGRDVRFRFLSATLSALSARLSIEAADRRYSTLRMGFPQRRQIILQCKLGASQTCSAIEAHLHEKYHTKVPFWAATKFAGGGFVDNYSDCKD
jgi:hypothetical protein